MKVVAHRWRLLTGGICGLAFGFASLLLGVSGGVSLLGGWCVATGCWLALALHMMLATPAQALRARTEDLDEGGAAVLFVVVLALLASLASIAIALAPPDTPRATVLLGFGTLALSWLCVHVLFAVHYAHEHCRAGTGIAFPGNEEPDFVEFLYFSLTVGMTFQVSDATTATPAVRRLVIAHALVSFLFNAAILGAAVNMAASLVH